jgi:hypothetical protein
MDAVQINKILSGKSQTEFGIKPIPTTWQTWL